MRCIIGLLATGISAGVAFGQGTPISPPGVSTPGGALSIACGTDGTAVIQAGLNAQSVTILPACPQANPIFISASLSIPSNAALRGLGRRVTWIKLANSSNLSAPMIQNSNVAGGASVTLNSNISVEELSIDGNGTNQTTNINNKCLYLLGVAGVSLREVGASNCQSDAIAISGNGSTTASPAFVRGIYVSGTVGAGNFGTGIGFQIGARERNATVSDVFVENTFGPGVLIDTSESSWENIKVKGAGTGSTCTAGSSNATVDNPGGGGASQGAWAPCSPGIWVRNVTNVVASNLVAHQGNYYGIIVSGARHTVLSNLVATQNSEKTLGTWDDLHLDLNTFVSSGYGENHGLVINGVNVGANGQTGTTGAALDQSAGTVRYGLFISDGQAGSIGDVTKVAGGTGYAFANSLTLTGGTSSIAAKLTVTTAPSGIIGTVQHDYTTGGGVYTVLPSNPVSVTGGTGTGATFNVTWSTAYITNVVIGQTLTAPTRLPSFITGWTVQTVGP